MNIITSLYCLVGIIVVSGCHGVSSSSDAENEEWLFVGTVSVDVLDRVCSELDDENIVYVIDSATLPAILVAANDVATAKKILTRYKENIESRNRDVPMDRSRKAVRP